eukprot:8775176-Heterocapsa_arctica.AAC.1
MPTQIFNNRMKIGVATVKRFHWAPREASTACLGVHDPPRGRPTASRRRELSTSVRKHTRRVEAPWRQQPR